MKLSLRYLAVILATISIKIESAYGQSLVANNIRLKPTSVPTFCNTGDLRVDTDDSNAFKICVSNTWYDIFNAGAASLTASRALVSNGSGILATSGVTSAEQSFLSGVTSGLCGTAQACTFSNKTFSDAISVTGAATFLNNMTVAGTLVSTGAVTLLNNLAVAGSLGQTGAATFGSNVTVAGVLVTTGAATFLTSIANAGALGQTGAATFGNNVTVTGTLNTTGVATFATHISTAGNATVTGNLFVTAASAFANNLTVAGTFNSTGAATLTSHLTVGGNTTITGTLNNTGAATFVSHLTVGGNTTVAALDTGLSTAGPVITDSSGVLSSEAKLAIARGGTNNETLAVTAGGALYTDGSKIMNTGAGTAGQVFQSNGASAPAWTNILTGNVITKSTASGTYTPTAGMRSVLVILTARGGSGGAGGNGSTQSSGGSGGAAQTCMRFYTAAEIGAGVSYSLGAVSANSVFSASVVLTAHYGTDGAAGSGATPGANGTGGSTAAVGVCFPGGDGDYGVSSGNAANAAGVMGGASYWGGGGSGGAQGGTGVAGKACGSGGGSGGGATGSAGGAGAGPCITFVEFL